MLLLGIDTSTKICTCSIYDSEAGVIAETSLSVKKNHSNIVMPIVDNLFKISDLNIKDIDKIAVAIGPGSFTGVRIIGPVRKETQVEISITDSFKLGLTPPIRQSGDLEGTPGIKIVGPMGEIEISKGVIVAGRHIHMPKYIADIRGYKDGEIVKVETYGERKIIMCNVVLRVSDKMAKEMHIDVDEANAAALKNNDYVKIIRE